MIIKQLVTKWLVKVDDKKLDGVDKKITKLKKGFKALGDGSIVLGRKLTTFVTLPIAALGVGLIKVASDAEETNSKFNTIFKDLKKGASEVADTFARDFGLAGSTSRLLLGNTSDLLTGFKFTQKQALDLSRQVNELAVDLASFTNFSGGATGASAALTKALLGERESIKSLGIAILEKDVKARVIQLKQQGKLLNLTDRQSKAFATLTLAQELSKNAIGDFSRTSGQFANQLRIVQQRILGVSESFGRLLLPQAQKVLNVVTKIVEFFGSLSETAKENTLIFLGFTAVLGPALIVFGNIITSIISIGVAVVVLTRLMKFLNIQFSLIPLAFIAGFAAMFLIFEDIVSFFQGDRSITAVVVNAINEILDALDIDFRKGTAIGKAMFALITLPVRTALQAVQALGGALGALTSGDFSGAFDAIKEGVSLALLPDFNSFRSLLGITGALDPSNRGTEVPTTGGTSVGGSTTITMNNKISVPTGTPPEVIGSALAEAAERVMSKSLRSANQALKTTVEF